MPPKKLAAGLGLPWKKSRGKSLNGEKLMTNQAAIFVLPDPEPGPMERAVKSQLLALEVAGLYNESNEAIGVAAISAARQIDQGTKPTAINAAHKILIEYLELLPKLENGGEKDSDFHSFIEAISQASK